MVVVVSRMCRVRRSLEARDSILLKFMDVIGMKERRGRAEVPSQITELRA
jgi:hypothetical protein